MFPITVTFGRDTVSLQLNHDLTPPGLTISIAEAFALPSEHIRLFSSGKLLTPEAVCEALKSNPGLLENLEVRSGLTRFCEFDGFVVDIVYSNPWRNGLAFVNRSRHEFGLTGVSQRHLALLQGDKVIDPLRRLPSIDEDPEAGFSVLYPLRLIRTDLITVTSTHAPLAVSTAGCATYGQVIESYRRHLHPEATSLYQIELTDESGNIIAHDSPVVPSDKPRTIHSKMIRRSVFISNDGDDEKEERPVQLTSDTILTSVYECLIEIDQYGQDITGERLFHLHMLKDGARYRRGEVHFGGWSSVESIAQENEVSLGVRRSLDQDGLFNVLPREILYDSTKTEWDVVYHDPKNDKLLFVEAKHKVTVDAVKNIIKRAGNLQGILKRARDEQFRVLASKPIQIIVAGLVFIKKAAELATANELLLCYITNSRYSVRVGAELGQDMKNATFTTRNK